MVDQKWQQVAHEMDAVLARFLDGELSAERAQGLLVGLWRQLIPWSPDKHAVKKAFSGGEIWAEQLHDLLEGRTAEEMQKALPIMQSAMFIAASGSDAGTA